MNKKVKVGYIGLGRRGLGVLKRNVAKMKDVEVVMVCDLDEKKLEEARVAVLERSGHEPILTKNYLDVINNEEIEAVFVMIGWTGRPTMAIEAMKKGKYTAIEVGCADSIDECFALVDAYEETGTPVMMLENCCYDRREMVAYNIVEQGLLGEVVHCTGAYMHNLNECEFFNDIEGEGANHYRLPLYMTKNRENYPTHALGPISKLLRINRGNRMVSLVSVASKSRGIKAYAARHFGEDNKYAKIDYKQGDIVDTVITCAGGETIHLQLDTTLPRSYYSRNFGIRGTEGFIDEARRVVWFEWMGGHSCIAESVERNEEEMFKKYEHPLYRQYFEEGIEDEGSHSSMDWLVCRAFIESVQKKINTPIDAYDAAVWLAVGPLSEASINAGGAAVEFPDFTRGKWNSREPAPECKYSLAKVTDEPETPIHL
ncbi:MAG: Gfo/Idh/MocA family oxidoreductase [Clostridia bacterium]|nr:Gfo/Idh/MocA family oxidoreductase [Clostridia bacterium]